MDQAVETLNILHTSITHLHLSIYEQMFGKFYLNATPFALTSTILLINCYSTGIRVTPYLGVIYQCRLIQSYIGYIEAENAKNIIEIIPGANTMLGQAIK